MNNLNFSELSKDSITLAGGKGASLGEMYNAGIPIPPGFVVLATTFEEFLKTGGLNLKIEEILARVDQIEVCAIENASKIIQSLILNATIPANIKQDIIKDFDKLGAKFVAVRSSATAEDGAENAWAGQLDSFLNTTQEDLLEKVQHCWASLFTPRAIFYRFEKGLNNTKISVAVVIQKMVNSQKSGIAFSVHPVTEDPNQLIIEAGFGLGEAIVSGQVTPDSYVVEKQPRNILDINVSSQDRAIYRKNQGGNEWKDIPELKDQQVLTKEQILELSEIILKIENHYGFPCDIEWAFEAGKFYIVQSRPITTLNDKKEIISSDKYFIFEELRDANPMVLHRFIDLPFVNVFLKSIGVGADISKAIIYYKGKEVFIYFNAEEFDDVAKSIVEIFISSPNNGYQLNNLIINEATKLIENNKNYQKLLILKKLSAEELLDIWGKMEEEYAQLFKFTWVHNALDFKDNLFSKYLFKYLEEYVKKHSIRVDINESFVELTTPDKKNTYLVKLEKELRDLNKAITQESINSIEDALRNITINKKLEDLANDFGWLGFGFDGPAWDKTYIFNLAINLPKENIKKVVEKRNILLQKLGFNKNEELLFELSRKVIESTEFRKEAMFNYYYSLDMLFDQLSSKLNMPKSHFRYIYPKEISSLLDMKDNISSRIECHIDYENSNKQTIMLDSEAETFVGSLDILSNIKFNGQFLEGQVAHPGLVRGIVKIVNQKSDVDKLQMGDILVSIATNPELLIAMKKAAAFVTDRGGITCHAAIISRELGTPCVVGTKIATQVLKDGDEVEVDADNGIVKIIKIK